MRNKSLYALLCGMLIMCSCATVREARKIQKDEVPRQPGEYTMSAPEAGIVAGETYTLPQLEAIALRCNPSMYQSALSVEQARIALANAKAGYLPTLSSSAGHNRSTSNRDRHHGSTRNTGSYSGGLNLSITVFDFGRTSAAIRQAQDSLDAAIKNFEKQRNTTIYNVRKAYFELRRAMALHEVAIESVSQYKDHLDQVKVKKEIGESIEYDVLKAEVDYQNARLQEISTNNTVAIDQGNLNYALGLAENIEFNLGECDIHEYAETAEALLETARANEPSLASLQYSINVASGSIDAAIADLYPNISLSFGGSVSGRNPALPWLWNLSSGLSLSGNSFNGGRTLNSVRQAVVSLHIARSRYAAAEQALYRDLRTATLNAQKARQSLEVAELSAKSAERNLDIVNEKYKYGKATSVDRTDAQVSASSAKAQAVNARFDFMEAQAYISSLIGD
ncbi:MAG: TolC family protein [Lentisphaeria bacterium]|nr:TolC family protein [Lentisphaeria bacterium]